MKYTIAIPAYKQKYLYEAIQSCLNQSYQDFEIVIVDDASPEDLISVVRKFDDKRIRYYRNAKNCGAKDVVNNWNICLTYAKGEYIICMGDDDRLLPNCLEEYDNLIKKYPAVNIVHGRTIKIDEHGDPISITSERMELESIYTFIWRRLKGRSQYIGDVCIKTETLRKSGGYYKLPFAWGSDEISAFIACGKEGVVNTFTAVFEYRVNRFTITKSGNEEEKLMALMDIMEWIRTFLKSNPPQDFTDKLIVQEIRNKWDYYLSHKQEGTIAPSIRRNKFAVFKWLFVRKKYNLGTKTIIRTLLRNI